MATEQLQTTDKRRKLQAQATESKRLIKNILLMTH